MFQSTNQLKLEVSEDEYSNCFPEIFSRVPVTTRRFSPDFWPQQDFWPELLIGKWRTPPLKLRVLRRGLSGNLKINHETASKSDIQHHYIIDIPARYHHGYIHVIHGGQCRRDPFRPWALASRSLPASSGAAKRSAKSWGSQSAGCCGLTLWNSKWNIYGISMEYL